MSDADQRTALVIDDDPFIAELLTILLENHGFLVDTQCDGIDGSSSSATTT